MQTPWYVRRISILSSFHYYQKLVVIGLSVVLQLGMHFWIVHLALTTLVHEHKSDSVLEQPSFLPLTFRRKIIGMRLSARLSLHFGNACCRLKEPGSLRFAPAYQRTYFTLINQSIKTAAVPNQQNKRHSLFKDSGS